MEAVSIKKCPVKTAMFYLGQKWNIDLIRDLMFKNRRFSDFLSENKGLSNKVLSQRLKQLETAKLVNKKIISKTPLKIEYELTERGYKLNKVLFELAQFSYEFYKDEIFQGGVMEKPEYIEFSKDLFKITET